MTITTRMTLLSHTVHLFFYIYLSIILYMELFHSSSSLIYNSLFFISLFFAVLFCAEFLLDHSRT